MNPKTKLPEAGHQKLRIPFWEWRKDPSIPIPIYRIRKSIRVAGVLRGLELHPVE
jgi:hypothetical protein